LLAVLTWQAIENNSGDEKVGKLMQVTNETQTGPTSEFKIIPTWAWTLAAVGFVGTQLLFNFVLARLRGDVPPPWALAMFGLVFGTILGCLLLLIVYINRDAKRRGMSPTLWTIIAVIIPNGLGIILYFVLRQPRISSCPQCGNTVQPGFNFCPRCNHKLSPSCPQCQRLVGANDTYCPYCGTSMNRPAPAVAGSPTK
jgi:RNA polymerase subunit RPABC4/transcription elongation factor Spt4